MNSELIDRINSINRGHIPNNYNEVAGLIIPNEWGVVNLGDIADFKNGLNYGKNDIGNPVKIVGVGDFKDNFYLEVETLDRIEVSNLSEEYFLQDGDLLFVRSNGNKELIGRVLYCAPHSEKVTFSGFTIRGRIQSNEFLDKYCAYYCSSKLVKKQYIKNGGGTNISNLSQGILSNVKVTKPSKEEQKKIIQIIETWDKAITIKENLLQEKQKQKAAVIDRIITGKVRLRGFTQAWTNIKLSQVLGVRNDKSKITDKLELYSLTIEDGVTPKTERYNREFLVKGDEKKYKLTRHNDIVYNPANLRFGAIALNKTEKDVLLSPIYETLYIKDPRQHDIGFIAAVLTSERQIKKFSTMAEGTLVERMSVKIKDFINFTIKVPMDIDEESKIAEIISGAEREIDLLKEEIRLLKDQKKGLMQLLLIGIVRVKCDQTSRNS